MGDVYNPISKELKEINKNLVKINRNLEKLSARNVQFYYDKNGKMMGYKDEKGLHYEQEQLDI